MAEVFRPLIRYWDESYNWVLPPDPFDITPWLGVLGIMQLSLVFTIADAETEEEYYRGAVEVPPSKEGETDAAPLLANTVWRDDKDGRRWATW